jgi:hypothetical protein
MSAAASLGFSPARAVARTKRLREKAKAQAQARVKPPLAKPSS